MARHWTRYRLQHHSRDVETDYIQKFKDKPLPSAENDALSSHPSLINRAIAMHLLREGEFGVASTFVEEANRHPPHPEPTLNTPNPYLRESWERDLAEGTFNSEKLQQQFADMYHILHELRNERNLKPAIHWAQDHSSELESRGSNLEFELCRLQYMCLFNGHTTQPDDSMSDEEDETPTGPRDAYVYGRQVFPAFQRRYAREIRELIGAMAYWSNVSTSPYTHLFSAPSTWSSVAQTFTLDFCSLLGLSASSPLFTATTAGAIALPYLLKLQTIMKEKRTEWTTQDELPVEIPLPSQFHFHSIFVCPVSKEQSTEQNPPMMLGCGHVIARESLEKISKGGRFKCPYCPNESHPREARKVVL
jgi:hypothetical protein